MAGGLADLLLMLLSFMTAPWQSSDTAGENIYHKLFQQSDTCKSARNASSMDVPVFYESLLECVVEVTYPALQRREVMAVIPLLYLAYHLDTTNEPVVSALALALDRIGRTSAAFDMLHSVVSLGLSVGEVKQKNTIINWASFAQRLNRTLVGNVLQASEQTGKLNQTLQLPVVQLLEAMEQTGNVNGTSKPLLHNLLATIYHDSDPHKSFLHTTQMNTHANILQFPSMQAKDEACKYALELLAAARNVYFTEDNMKRWQADLLSSKFYDRRKPGSRAQPLFIVGTQGSGTSLLERILDSHPNVRGLGEPTVLDDVVMEMYRRYRNGKWVRPDGINASFFGQSLDKLEEGFDKLEREAIAKDSWSLQNFHENCNRVAGKNLCEENFIGSQQEGMSWAKRRTRYIATKQSADFMHIGAMRLLFPESPIVHVSRDLRDVALSNLRKFFSDALPWTFSLRDIVNYLRAYRQTMVHWDRVLPSIEYTAGDTQCIAYGESQCSASNARMTSHKMIHIRYEDLVREPEATVRSLLQQLKLSSSDADVARCLSGVGNKPTRGFPTLRIMDAQELVLRNSGSWKSFYDILPGEDQEHLRQLQELEEASELRSWLFSNTGAI